MKNLGEASYVLGIEISRDRERGLLGLSQKGYIEKVLRRFNMENCAGRDVPFSKGDKLSMEQSPKTEQEKLEMVDKPYASLVRSLICKSAIWLKNLITSLRVVDSIERPVQIWNNNSAAVFFTKSNKRSSCTRHLKFKYLSIRENVRDGLVKLDHIGTHSMIVDPLSKGLPNGVFHGHVGSMGLVSSFDRED
ncbi:unnamed protein product [Prunus armeniaca]